MDATQIAAIPANYWTADLSRLTVLQTPQILTLLKTFGLGILASAWGDAAPKFNIDQLASALAYLKPSDVAVSLPSPVSQDVLTSLAAKDPAGFAALLAKQPGLMAKYVAQLSNSQVVSVPAATWINTPALLGVLRAPQIQAILTAAGLGPVTGAWYAATISGFDAQQLAKALLAMKPSDVASSLPTPSSQDVLTSLSIADPAGYSRLIAAQPKLLSYYIPGLTTAQIAASPSSFWINTSSNLSFLQASQIKALLKANGFGVLTGSWYQSNVKAFDPKQLALALLDLKASDFPSSFPSPSTQDVLACLKAQNASAYAYLTTNQPALLAQYLALMQSDHVPLLGTGGLSLITPTLFSQAPLGLILGLTGAQMQTLTSGTYGWNLSNLPLAIFPNLTANLISNASASSLIGLSKEQISLLSSGALAGLTAAQATAINSAIVSSGSKNPPWFTVFPSQWGALSKEALLALFGSVGPFFDQFGFGSRPVFQDLLDMSGIPAHWTNVMTLAEIDSLKPIAVRSLVSSQTYNMSSAQWAELIKAGKFQYLDSNVIAQGINPNVVPSLPADFFSNISATDFPHILPAVIGAMTPAQVAALRPDQVWNLTSQQLTLMGSNAANLSAFAVFAMTPQQVAAIPNVTLKGPTIEQASTQFMSGVSVDTLNNLPEQAFARFSNAQLAAITKATCLNLNPQLYDELSESQKSAMASAPAYLLSPADLVALGTAGIALLLPDTITSLSAMQIASLSPDQLKALSIAQIQALNPIVVQALPTSVMAQFTTAQMQAITTDQLAGIAAPQATAMKSSFSAQLTTAQIGSLTAALGADAFKIDPKITALRNLYKIPKNAQDMAGLASAIADRNKFFNPAATTSASSTLPSLSLSNKAWTTVVREELWLKQKGDFAANAEAKLRSVRAVGGLLSASAVALQIDSMTAVDYTAKGGVVITQDVLNVVAWTAAALKIPATVILKAIVQTWNNSDSAGQLEKVKTLLKGAGVDVPDQATLTQVNTILTSMANGNIELAKQNIAALNLASQRKGAQTVTLASAGAPSAGQLQLQNISRDPYYSKNPVVKYSANVLADFLGGAASIYGLVKSGMSGDPNAIGSSVGEVIGSSAYFTASMLEMSTEIVAKICGERAIAGLSVADAATLEKTFANAVKSTESMLKVASKGVNAVGASAAGIVAAGMGIDSAINQLKNKQITEEWFAASIISQSLQGITSAALLGIEAAEMAASIGMLTAEAGLAASGVGLPLALILAGAQILMPNFAAISQALNYERLADQARREGRTVMADLVYSRLRTIAILDAIPIVNWFSGIYTDAIMAQIYHDMKYGGMAQALAQDYVYNVTISPDGQVYLARLQAMVQYSQVMASVSGGKGALTDVLILTPHIVDGKNYFAYKTSTPSYYLSSVDATATGSSVSVTPQGVVPTSPVDMTVKLSDQGTGSKMVVINSPGDEIVTVDKTVYRATQKLIVDASGSNMTMFFMVNYQNTDVRGGSAANTYTVDQSYESQGGINIWGGSSHKDTVQMIAAPSATGSINLDYLHDVAVQASDNVRANNVWGTASKQKYTYAGGVDFVTMTGGKAEVHVGGLGTQVRLGGGNNVLAADLGSDPLGLEASGLISLSAVSYYSGGAPVAATYDNAGNLINSGENTINFSAAAAGLKMDIIDPAQRSTVSLNIASGYTDNAGFSNFQRIIGSNLGDCITVSNTSRLDQLLLGAGNNDVGLSNVQGLTVHSGPGSNRFLLQNNTDVLIGTVNGANQIVVKSGSTLHALLNGATDVVDATNDPAGPQTTGNQIDVQTETGMHTIYLNNQQSLIQLEGGTPVAANNWTNVVDTATRTTSLIMELGSDLQKEVVSFDASGMHVVSSDGSNERLDYSYAGVMANDKFAFVQTTYSAQDLRSADVGVDLIYQAYNAMSSAGNAMATTAFNGSAVRGYTMASIVNYLTQKSPGLVTTA